MKVCHILSKDEVCTINATSCESLAACFASSWTNNVPRFMREFEAHHLVLSLRSCVHVLPNQICCFSRLYAVKAEHLYVDAAFYTGGGWASRENNCEANAITCVVWHGCVFACSIKVKREIGSWIFALRPMPMSLPPTRSSSFLVGCCNNRTESKTLESCALALRTDLRACAGMRECPGLPLKCTSTFPFALLLTTPNENQPKMRADISGTHVP